MAKFSGLIGFSLPAETRRGVYAPSITEKKYRGDVVKNARRYTESADTINSGLTLSNTISIVADKFAKEHIGLMRYVVYGGVKWKIESVDIAYPRINLTIGGMYNGDENR